MVIKALHPVTYFHTYFNKYFNLLSKFSTSCNLKGEFTDTPINSKLLFHNDVLYHSKLEKCNNHVNKIDWLENCQDFCGQFKLLNFNTKFFSPSMKKFVRLTKFYNDRLTEWDA